ncbi:hypothetical protein L7F22_028833 [Adiantum nelumboides]|nr:hypothetical protein [Adiantum nelumboides]
MAAYSTQKEKEEASPLIAAASSAVKKKSSRRRRKNVLSMKKKEKTIKTVAENRFEWPKPAARGRKAQLYVLLCSKSRVKADCLQYVEKGVVGLFEDEEQAYAEAIHHEIAETQRLEKEGWLLESAERIEELGGGGVNTQRFASTLQRKALQRRLETAQFSSMKDLYQAVHTEAQKELWDGSCLYGFCIECTVIESPLFPAIDSMSLHDCRKIYYIIYRASQ